MQSSPVRACPLSGDPEPLRYHEGLPGAAYAPSLERMRTLHAAKQEAAAKLERAQRRYGNLQGHVCLQFLAPALSAPLRHGLEVLENRNQAAQSSQAAWDQATSGLSEQTRAILLQNLRATPTRKQPLEADAATAETTPAAPPPQDPETRTPIATDSQFRGQKLLRLSIDLELAKMRLEGANAQVRALGVPPELMEAFGGPHSVQALPMLPLAVMGRSLMRPETLQASDMTADAMQGEDHLGRRFLCARMFHHLSGKAAIVVLLQEQATAPGIYSGSWIGLNPQLFSHTNRASSSNKVMFLAQRQAHVSTLASGARELLAGLSLLLQNQAAGPWRLGCAPPPGKAYWQASTAAAGNYASLVSVTSSTTPLPPRVTPSRARAGSDWSKRALSEAQRDAATAALVTEEAQQAAVAPFAQTAPAPKREAEATQNHASPPAHATLLFSRSNAPAPGLVQPDTVLETTLAAAPNSDATEHAEEPAGAATSAPLPSAAPAPASVQQATQTPLPALQAVSDAPISAPVHQLPAAAPARAEDGDDAALTSFDVLTPSTLPTPQRKRQPPQPSPSAGWPPRPAAPSPVTPPVRRLGPLTTRERGINRRAAAAAGGSAAQHALVSAAPARAPNVERPTAKQTTAGAAQAVRAKADRAEAPRTNAKRPTTHRAASNQSANNATQTAQAKASPPLHERPRTGFGRQPSVLAAGEVTADPSKRKTGAPKQQGWR